MSRFIGNVSAYAYAVEKGYTGTEEEFAELMASYATVGQTAVEAAQTATTKASEASQSATTATNKASEATTAAQTATNKAAEAQSSAQTASTKASEATTAATAAQTAKTQTEAAATQALTDISTARSGSISAIQTEGETLTANVTAQAQAAAQSATTASTKASEASASATTATTKATEAAASATSAAQSASDAQDVLDSIPTDYSALSANVSRLKADLGDLENLDTTDKSNLVSAINEVAQTGGADAVSLLKEQIYNSYPNVEAETGSIISISDGADDIPVKSLVVGIEPAQAGSGDPSPTNVRPISGWTGVEVTVSPTTDAEDGDTYDITFPSEAGTVYGGTLDVTTGILTVDMDIVDMGTLNWVYYSTQQRIVAQINSAKPAGTNIGLDGACSVYKVVNTAYRLAPDKSIVIGNNFISNLYAAMVVHDEDYTDAETFKTAVSGQKLVFPIKTPVTYQLTPQEITTLLGENCIWADTGNVSLVYRADTKLYIDGVDYRPMLAPVESTYTATRNYTTGQLLIVGNTLYKVTANIANGGNIIPNTNVTATTLSEVILALA